MKTLITMIVTLCFTTISFAQSVTEKETIIKITPQEHEQIQGVKALILDLSSDLRSSLEEKEVLSKTEMITLKKLLEAIDKKYEGEKINKKIIIKAENPSKNTSISYAFSIDNDDEIETLEQTKNLDWSELEEKLSELSISLNDSDAIQSLVKKLKEKTLIIHQEIEENKEKTKH